MANNYLQFAEEYDLPSPCVTWLQVFLDTCRAIEDEEVSEEERERIYKVIGDACHGGDDPQDYVTSIVNTFSLYGAGGSLYVAAEESGDVDLVGNILHAMLKETDSDLILKLEWAVTCSAARPGEFGGGAMVICKEGVDSEGTGEAASRMVKRLRSKRADK